MVVTITTVVWFDEKLWNENNLIGRWSSRMATTLTNHTRREAPFNKRMVKTDGAPGDLIASIRHTSRRVGLRTRDFTVSMEGYAVYVIRGTGPQIRSDSGGLLWLPDNGAFNSISRPWHNDSRRQGFEHVPGQDANDFLGRAWDHTALEFPSIRGKLRDD